MSFYVLELTQAACSYVLLMCTMMLHKVNGGCQLLGSGLLNRFHCTTVWGGIYILDEK